MAPLSVGRPALLAGTVLCLFLAGEAEARCAPAAVELPELQVGGKKIGGGGGKGYVGPKDTSPGGSPTEPPTETPLPIPEQPVWPGAPATQVAPPQVPQPTAAQPLRGLWGPDTGDWTWWWQWQRWPRFEVEPAPEPARAITPGGEGGAPPAETAQPGAPTPPPPPPAAATRVVPALLAAWEKHPPRPEIRAALLISLARSGSGPDVGAALRSGLDDADLLVVESAALGLGILGEPHGIPALTALVRDEPEARSYTSRHEASIRVRAFAAYGLGLIAERTPYEPLRDGIADALLSGIPKSASATDDLGVACVLALGLFPGEDAADLLPPLQELLRDRRQREKVRAAAPIAMAKLVARSRDPGSLARTVFLDCRRRLFDRGDNVAIRQSCALALGRLGSIARLAEDAAEALRDAQGLTGDPRMRQLAAVALGEIGAGTHPAAQTIALPALMAGMERGTDVDRSWSAFALAWSAAKAREQGRSLPPTVARMMLERFPDANRSRTRSATSLALGLLDHAPSEERIQEEIDSLGDPNLRAEALAGLALLGGPTALDRALQELEHVDPLIDAFQVICSAAAHHAPVAMLRTFEELIQRDSASYTGRFAAAIGLGWLRDPQAVEPLLGLWHDDEDTLLVQVAAVSSLGRVAERPGPRWNAGYLDLLNPYAAPLTLLGDGRLPGVCDRF